MKSRYCYNYIPPNPVCAPCKPVVAATNQYLSSIACSPNVVNNSTKTTQGSFLLANQKQQKQDEQVALQSSTIQSTITNATAITNDLLTQLQTVRNQRYAPYQPYVPPVMPADVMELKMRTANVGVPMGVFTMADCKGSQFTTK
jgi:hypothetical protein